MTYHAFQPDTGVQQPWARDHGLPGLPCAVEGCGQSELSPIHLEPVHVHHWEATDSQGYSVECACGARETVAP